ncbi:MAG: hypothetical protein NTX53_20105 [candidate division WOR-3 bacterium]|nr:hypothetical protein [candidate division WOR-3 bacterium]
MVRRLLAALTGLPPVCLLVFCACRPKVDFPPRLETNAVPDTAQVIVALPPDSGVVQVSKNGYRLFDLDAIVTDEDDADSTIRWSLSPGSLLNVNLNGSLAEIGPVPNQAGVSYVVFTATDPVGLSTSKTCPILVFDEFKTDSLPDTIVVSRSGDTTVVLKCQYRASLKPKLIWGAPSYDSTYLGLCFLSGSPDSGALTVQAKGTSGTTGISLTVRDSVNHVTFNYGIPVTIR